MAGLEDNTVPFLVAWRSSSVLARLVALVAAVVAAGAVHRSYVLEAS